MLKITRIGDKIVAILAFSTVKGWLPALGKESRASFCSGAPKCHCSRDNVG